MDTIETYLGVWIVCLTDQEQLKLNQPIQNSQFLSYAISSCTIKAYLINQYQDSCFFQMPSLYCELCCFVILYFLFSFFFFWLSCFLLLLLLCFRGINEKLIIQYQYSRGFICDFNRFSAVTKTPKESHSYRKCSSFRR